MVYYPFACSKPNLEPYPPAISKTATSYKAGLFNCMEIYLPSPLAIISTPISRYYYYIVILN
jgi:hypothetical protein